MYISGAIFPVFPASIFKMTYDMTPNAIPSQIEYMNAIEKIVMNAGIASVRSVTQSICDTSCIIRNPFSRSVFRKRR